MDPYLAFALAMCVIIGLSLAGTAYLAVVFNRRAKADLEARLSPLAAAIGGEIELDEAVVKGRYLGQLAFGRVANAPGGIGRLFHVEVVDAAGGQGWEWSSLPVKGRPEPERAFAGDPEIERRLAVDWGGVASAVPDAARQRFGVAYDPAAGMVRLTRAMRTRIDIPDPATFVRQLDVLIRLGEANRRAQDDQNARTAVAPQPAAAGDADRHVG